MERSETIKEIATALCKFQNTVEVVLKDAENPFYKSKYASLGKVLEVIRKPMFDNGLSFVQLPEESDELITILMHTSGEWISSKYKMVPVKSDPQSKGSAITYQRRYAITSILGIAVDDDDDGNKGSDLKVKNEIAEKKTPEQLQAELDNALFVVLGQIPSTKTVKELTDMWNKNKALQKNEEFIKAIKDHRYNLENPAQ